jgi:hypothetical protein
MSLWQRLLRRVLFVEEPVGTPMPLAGTDQANIVTVLLHLRHGMTLRKLTNVLEELGPALSKPRAGWPIEQVTILRGVRLSRPLVFFFELTRTRAVAASLCEIAGEKLPPPFHLSLCPQFEAMIELRFSGEAGADAIAAVRESLHERAIFNEPVLVGSGFQVLVYDSGSTTDVMKRVNICFLLRRPPGVTREECQTYWRENHAQLALHNMRYLRLTRYRQIHTLPTPPAGLDDTFDGVVYAEKPSYLQLFLDLLKPNTARFNNSIVLDECHFTDATPVTLMRRIGRWKPAQSSLDPAL